LSTTACVPFMMATCGSIAESPTSVVVEIVFASLLPGGATAAPDTRAPGGIITTAAIITTIRHASPIQRRRRRKRFAENEPTSGRTTWGADTGHSKKTGQQKPLPGTPLSQKGGVLIVGGGNDRRVMTDKDWVAV
jgi:hypothetical protein